jgi:hypothetical protein
MIAAVQTETPELSPDAAARLAQADRELTKYNYNPAEPRDWHGRWTRDGSAAPAVPPAPAIETDERTAGAGNRARRVAEKTFQPGDSVSTDAPISSDNHSSRAPDDDKTSPKPTTFQETFEQKYDDLRPEDFSKKVTDFGYWLETHGRELSPAERESALAEYSFLQNRLSLWLNYEYKSVQEHGYLVSAASRLYQGAFRQSSAHSPSTRDEAARRRAADRISQTVRGPSICPDRGSRNRRNRLGAKVSKSRALVRATLGGKNTLPAKILITSSCDQARPDSMCLTGQTVKPPARKP